MCEVREESSVSNVLMRRIVLLVNVAICKYAARKAGERAGPGCALCGVGVWLGVSALPF